MGKSTITLPELAERWKEMEWGEFRYLINQKLRFETPHELISLSPDFVSPLWKKADDKELVKEVLENHHDLSDLSEYRTELRWVKQLEENYFESVDDGESEKLKDKHIEYIAAYYLNIKKEENDLQTKDIVDILFPSKHPDTAHRNFYRHVEKGKKIVDQLKGISIYVGDKK